ncbi:MAG: GNAT family N-acetyltransferase, partial [Clostridia bacterium]|nr:GNAT family N-acetyltransferase [Clostridia bacterium]
MEKLVGQATEERGIRQDIADFFHVHLGCMTCRFLKFAKYSRLLSQNRDLLTNDLAVKRIMNVQQIRKLLQSSKNVPAARDLMNEYNISHQLPPPQLPDRVIITVKNPLDAGDAGRMIAMHGQLYQKESGYNQIFEGYVCKTFFEALTKAETALDRYWLAEVDGEIVGSAAIIDRGAGICQFRWLLVAPENRRSGLGKQLFREAMAYAASGPFHKIYLETTIEQEKAVRMYRNDGFVETDRYEIRDWGVDLIGL